MGLAEAEAGLAPISGELLVVGGEAAREVTSAGREEVGTVGEISAAATVTVAAGGWAEILVIEGSIAGTEELVEVEEAEESMATTELVVVQMVVAQGSGIATEELAATERLVAMARASARATGEAAAWTTSRIRGE